LAERLSRYYQWIPSGLRTKTLPTFLNLIPPQQQKKGLINKTKRMIEGAALDPALQHTRWMIFMSDADKKQLYSPSLRMAMGEYSVSRVFESIFGSVAQFDPLAQQQYVDIKTYLPGDILTKVDRMSMAVSLEARVPLLDHRIVEFALNLPPRMKLNLSHTKIILRKAMQQRIPEQVLKKPKQGFSIPMKNWLRSSLRPMMTDLLSEDRIHRRDYFNPRTVTSWVQEHLEERVNHSHRLWALVVFELWNQSLG
jgi:asparagine synthase (glutamine-hydrolysing)